METEWIPIVAIVGSFVMVIMVVSIVARSRQRRVEVHAEVQSKLIDRFGSAPELVTFLQSQAGREFVTGVQSAPAMLTRERLMSGFSRSIVLTMLGAAFLGLTFFYDNDWAVPAAIILCLGLGQLIATYVSYKLSEKLLNTDQRMRTGEISNS